MIGLCCASCLHVREEHHGRRCLPSIPGGSPCDCKGYRPWAVQADMLRDEGRRLLAEADRIDRLAATPEPRGK